MKTDVNSVEENFVAATGTALAVKSSSDSLFESFTKSLNEHLGDEVFSSWFGRLQLDYITDEIVRLSVPTAFLRSWINTHYLTVIEELWQKKLNNLVKVEIVIRSATRTSRVAANISVADNNKVNKSLGSSLSHKDKNPVVSPNISTQQRMLQPLTLGSPLDPKYTFDNFVEGASNRMALAAAKTVAEAGSGAVRFNPLFIHASVGMGKTHLLQAIAINMLSRITPVKVVYFTAEYFMWRFAMAIRDNNALLLKEQLRNIDLLIIDDMQFLQGKSIQNEFCHLLNLLLDSAKQVVVAADRPVAELEMLDDRVKSRLQGGVALEIGHPDYNMRLQMLQHKLSQAMREDSDLKIDEKTLVYVASVISGSGRDIEGAFNQLLVCKSFGGELSFQRVGELISHLMRPNDSKRIKIEDIQKIVARHYNVSKQDLLSNRRTRTIVKPRQVAMYLSKILTPRSLPEIGRRFGGRDHTTVLHAVRKIEGLLDEDKSLFQDIETLKQLVQDQS